MITSTRNVHIRRARKLRKRGMRARARQFLVEGPTAVKEALESGRPVEMLIVEAGGEEGLADVLGLAKRGATPVLHVSEPVMQAVSSATTPPGVVALASFLDTDAGALADRPLDLALVLAQVRDPGNLGTILRTAWAVGSDGVFLGEGTVDVYNPKAVRASAGAIFHVPFAREVELPWLLGVLEERGIRRIAADPRAPTVYDEVDMTGPCAFVLGNEAWGLPEEIGERVDVRASIPLPGSAESLNVGIAAALFLFEAVRQRRRR